jgi:hypothetical protein
VSYQIMSKLDFKVDSREIRRYFTALSGYLVHGDIGVRRDA